MLLDSLQTIHGAHREPTHHTHIGIQQSPDSLLGLSKYISTGTYMQISDCD